MFIKLSHCLEEHLCLAIMTSWHLFPCLLMGCIWHGASYNGIQHPSLDRMFCKADNDIYFGYVVVSMGFGLGNWIMK